MNYNYSKMSEDKISTMASDIAKGYLNGKNMLGIEEYIETYLDIYETAMAKITERENAKIKATEVRGTSFR